jgi:RNA polymerase sigma-70 factor (ECF subfamily)
MARGWASATGGAFDGFGWSVMAPASLGRSASALTIVCAMKEGPGGLAADPSVVWSHADDVARLARQLCQHREDAEDVAQTSLLKASQRLDGFRGEASVRTWLHRITANECWMLRRRVTARSLDAILESPTLLPGAAHAAEADPESLVEDRELGRLVVTAIAALPNRQRAALILSDGGQLSAEEVARALGATVSSVRSLLVRARRSLRAQIARELGLPAGQRVPRRGEAG